MKLVLFIGILAVGLFAQSQTCTHGQDPFAYVVGEVSSTHVVDLDQNQTECTFQVAIHYGNSTIDYNCPLDLYEAELATYVDTSCFVKVGDQINHSTTKYDNGKILDRSSPGYFYWIVLGGHSSQNVFPNYGK